jgi:hypothetical protein
MGNKSRGLYRKFIVYRTDGSSERGRKHDGCEYFVLDLNHDPHAKAAIIAYAKSCRADYPRLAVDLMNQTATHRFGGSSTSETSALPPPPTEFCPQCQLIYCVCSGEAASEPYSAANRERKRDGSNR